MNNTKRLLTLLTPLTLVAAFTIPLMEATPASAQAVCADPYIVDQGETLAEIAVTCDVTVSRLQRLNPQIEEADGLEIGMHLDIPQNGVYTVRAGDTLSEIAVRYRTTVSRLLNKNPSIEDPNIIYTNQVLQVPVLGAGAGDDIYIVQRGDTLSEIAARFNLTLNEILNINPEIDDPSLILTGQVIELPEGAQETPVSPAYVSITPLAGAPGTTVAVRGYNFPPKSTVEIGPGVFGSEAVYLNSVTTDTSGSFTASIVIPAAEADPGETWTIVVLGPEEGFSVRSSIFRVIDPVPGVDTYVVRPGDTLTEIAQMFGITVDRLMELNPQIENRHLIYAGQALKID